ncbi:unnamed protein product [Vitrella brassicaformis CCMP3155]|uniref:Uncharacterized protein n=1 Tax=Vitrella brassicaformis (strain CCMP3155) TaxID=1169540 RepID=A0A0G4FFY3_VITBC|nr:unnamed protein product [Vitrella brassicaformis CCMP3155]|eukprot:CEM11772.1 unnamed protein product [Vitrella brassicaformis CCMP3155]
MDHPSSAPQDSSSAELTFVKGGDGSAGCTTAVDLKRSLKEAMQENETLKQWLRGLGMRMSSMVVKKGEAVLDIHSPLDGAVQAHDTITVDHVCAEWAASPAKGEWAPPKEDLIAIARRHN